MEYQKSKQLFEAIKKDDVNTFEYLITSNADLNICFGRFPLLSVCYLYGSYRILNKFETKLLSKSAFDVHEEFFEIYLKFKTHAKKSIRLFLNEEIVYPILMLAALDEKQKIAKYYKYLYKNDKIIEKLTKIYRITNLEYVQATSNEFVAPKKKKSKRQKIFLSIIACVICLSMVFPIISILFVSNTLGLGTEANPIKVKNEKSLVNAISSDFEYISVEKDISFTEETIFESFSGTVNGNGKTVYIDENQVTSLFTNLTGRVSNINFVIKRTNLTLDNDFAFLAENITGKVENCTFSGSLYIEIVSEEEVDVSIFAITNNGEINDCVSDVEITCNNLTSHNAFLTTFAIVNNGQISDSRTTSKTYQTSTVDVTGFVIENNGTILDCTNNLNIYQESSEQWHPNTAGFAIDNGGKISGSKNTGEIKSISTNENSDTGEEGSAFVLYAGGIAVNNDGTIIDSENTGNIYGNSVIANNFVAGIACRNLFSYYQKNFYITISNKGTINSCNNSGEIISISTGSELEAITCYAGGIVGNNFTVIANCINTGNIIANSNSTQIYAGGIVGGSFYATNYSSGLDIYIVNSVSKSNITANTIDNNLAVGGIAGFCENVEISESGFIGKIEINSGKAYVGGIAGYMVSNYSYWDQSSASIIGTYSALTFVDNTVNDNNENQETTGEGENEENSEQEGETSEIEENNQPTKFVSSIAGLIISNTTTLYFSSNKCVKSEIPVMQYKFSTSNTINEVDVEKSNTTLYNSVEELLASLENEEE